MKGCCLRVGMGMAADLLVLLLLFMASADATRDAFNPVASDTDDGSKHGRGNHPSLGQPPDLHKLRKLFEKEVPSLDGLPTEFCHPCLDMSRKVKEILGDQRLFSEVDHLSSSFCHIVPSDLEAKCINIVDMYKHEAVMFLQDAFHKENLCYNSGFCPDKAQESSLPSYIMTELLTAMEPFTEILSKLHKELTKEAASRFIDMAKSFTENEIPLELRSNGTCIACRTVLVKIRYELEDPDKQLKIITSLLKMCEIEVFTYRCKKLVFTYGPIVISNLQRIVSMDLCRMAQICKDAQNQTSHMDSMSFMKSGHKIPSATARLDEM